MKKRDLIEAISLRTGEHQGVVGIVIDSFIDIVNEQLKNQEPVDIYGFAKFESVIQPARTIKVPKTGEIKENPEKLVPKCRFKQSVKTKLN